MNLILPIYSVFLLILLQTIFYSKKRINSQETTIYSYLMIISSFNIVFNIIGISLGYNNGSTELLIFINHLDLPLYFLWSSLLYLYLVSVYLENNKRYFRIKKIVIILNCIFTIITFILPFEVIITETEGYASGLCVNFVYAISALYIIASIIIAFLLVKKGSKRKTIPVFVLLAMGVLAAIVQKEFPNLIIIPSIIVFIEFIMFFTIENPDLKMMEIYNKNKELVENSIEDKTNLLFKISEDVKEPIRMINKISNSIVSEDDNNKIHDKAREINALSDGVITMLNEVLNVSTLEKSKIKIVDSTYNIYNLFSQIIYIVKNKEMKNIDFKYSISNVIPEKLYGDSSKLKQIICSIIFSAINNTESGTIDLDISSIVKFDICRLIIVVRDTGTGISLINTNDILDKNDLIDNQELERIDKLDLDLKLVKRVVELLGGTFLIQSEEGKGTIFTVILNQLIDTEKSESLIEPIVKTISNKKRLLVIDDDYKELDMIANALKKENFEVITTMYGKDLIDRINNQEKYDLIFIDDEMSDFNAVSTISLLKKEDMDNNKIIVMLDKDKEFIKDHYLNDYHFTDYFLKAKLKEEIERIKEKYN